MKKSLKYSLSVFVSVVLGVFVFGVLGILSQSMDLRHAALGENTVGRAPVLDGREYSSIDASGADWIKANANENSSQTILWLGASQLHSINEYQNGDLLAVDHANQSNRDRKGGSEYFLRSYPNASYYDLLSMYIIADRKDINPDWLVVALVYDDLREINVKDELIASIENETSFSFLNERIKESNSGKSEEKEESPQEILEEKLVSTMEDHFPGYANRGKLSGWISLKITGGMNSIARQSKNYTPPEITSEMIAFNNPALFWLVEQAKNKGTKVLLYRQPIKQTDPFYHDRDNYDQYFDAIESLCNSDTNLHYLDLESLVRNDQYGITNIGTPDMFHFTEAGHQKLGKEIDNFFKNHE